MRPIDADAYAVEMKKRQDACEAALEESTYEGNMFTPRQHWDGVFVAFVEAKLVLDDMPTVGELACESCQKWEHGDGIGVSARKCEEWGRITSKREFCSRWKDVRK